MKEDEDKKLFQTKVSRELVKELKIISATHEKHLIDLVDEALNLLVKKYKEAVN
jgi:predicted GTPase